MAKGFKTGGREKNTPNMLTKELREKISDFLNKNWEQVEKDFQVLEPDKRLMFFEKLIQYTLPRLQSIQAPDMKAGEIHRIVFKDFSTKEEREKRINELKKKLIAGMTPEEIKELQK
jgi:hypothetical protein